MSKSEKLYTLEEAQRILDERECDIGGHNFYQILGGGSPDPIFLSCYRCGKGWYIEKPTK